MTPSDDALYCALPEQVRAFVQATVTAAWERLQNGESVQTAMFLNSTGGSEMHKIPIDTSSTQSKDACAVYARQLAALRNSTACVFMSESWGLSKSDARRHEYILDRYGAIANYPGRLDLLFLNVETQEGTFAFQAEIVACPPSKKKRTLKVVEGFFRADSSSGRLSSILPPQARGPAS